MKNLKGGKCSEEGCDRILSFYNPGPKCFFHSLDKEAQEELNQSPSRPEITLCSSGPCGIAAHKTFLRYDGYKE